MDQIHTRIDTPIACRKKVLEAALLATETLKLRDTVLRLDEGKKIFRNQLRGMIKDMQKQMDNLCKSIPELPEEFTQEGKENELQGYQQFIPTKERIEEDLEDIRKRMRALNTNTKIMPS